MGEFAKFILAGVINTLVGYSTFWVGIHAFGLSPFLSNASGYAVALAIAYLLNRHFVFSSHRAIPTGGGSRDAGSIIRFLFAFVFAFALNQLTLWGAIGICHIQAEIAQIFAMVVYTIIFFLSNKYFVFRQHTGGSLMTDVKQCNQ